MRDWRELVVGPQTPLRQSVAVIDRAGRQVALVVSEGRLVGILSDGDVRRAILRGVSLDTPTSEVMNRKPKTGNAAAGYHEHVSHMRREVVRHLPLVDSEHRITGVVLLDELLGTLERSNNIVLMAGGLGTRLMPLTERCPKPMLKVGGKPILERIIQSLADQGFREFNIAVNYMAEMIKDHFCDGQAWGVNIRYLHEEKRLGTAGALSLLPKMPQESVIVMNADLLTRMRVDSLLDFHTEHEAMATMAVREYDVQVPYGVVKLDGQRIEAIEEKPVHRFFVNAGIYVLSPQALCHIPADTFFDMPTLFERLMQDGYATAAYPLREYWLDIGRLEEFERAQHEWIHDGGVN